MSFNGSRYLLHQTYGNGTDDAICHAVSADGIHFERNSTNPISRPTGEWNCGHALRNMRQTIVSERSVSLVAKQPAGNWNEALPVGNGRLGAMIFGNPSEERIQLNEESLWAGAPVNNNNTEALANLSSEIQRLILENKVAEAVKVAEKSMVGTPPRIRSYQTLGDLQLNFGERAVESYQRELDLHTGIVRTSYNHEGTRFTQEVLASAPDNLTQVRISASRKQKINVTLNLLREKGCDDPGKEIGSSSAVRSWMRRIPQGDPPVHT